MVAVGEFFSFRPDWHQDDRADSLVRQYQLTLRTILRDRPDLAKCAVACCHCGIRFLTHPRNANRRDLRCPFGCREHHRRQQANERSKRYYQTDQGRRNKKRQNGKRSVADGGSENGEPSQVARSDGAMAVAHARSRDRASATEPATLPTSEPTVQSSQADFESAARNDVKVALDGFALDEITLVNSSMLPYLATIATVLEKRAIGVQELLYLLRTSMRQRSFDTLPRREYVLSFLDQHPP